MTDRLPTIFLSHGAPPLPDDPVFSQELADLGKAVEKPKAILIVSAHWEEAPLTLGATETVPLFYDFYGFPQKYYEVQYRAPGAPDLAEEVRRRLRKPGMPIHDEPTRGLDHGAYVPLKEMYPEADIPVLQISMPTLNPKDLLQIGQKLAPLRDQGVLVVGSGFSTHNIREIRPFNGAVPTWSSEFDDWLAKSLESGDVDALADFQAKAPAAMHAHPTTEHFAPLFVAIGASMDSAQGSESLIKGFWWGLSKRSVRFD